MLQSLNVIKYRNRWLIRADVLINYGWLREFLTHLWLEVCFFAHKSTQYFKLGNYVFVRFYIEQCWWYRLIFDTILMICITFFSMFSLCFHSLSHNIFTHNTNNGNGNNDNADKVMMMMMMIMIMMMTMVMMMIIIIIIIFIIIIIIIIMTLCETWIPKYIGN